LSTIVGLACGAQVLIMARHFGVDAQGEQERKWLSKNPDWVKSC